MKYLVTTAANAEAIQKLVHYTYAMSVMYNKYVPSAISPEGLQAMYGASKPFLDCTIDECWVEGYNRVLGYKDGQLQTNFKGQSTDFSQARETVGGSWAMKKPNGIKRIDPEFGEVGVLDLSGYEYTIEEDVEFPTVEL